jgi:tetratricopeptide (TPR) repeat protein
LNPTVDDLKKFSSHVQHFASAIIVIFIILFFTISFSIAQESARQFIVAGDSLYTLYDYRGSAREYEEAARIDSNSFNAFWKLGRSLNFVGEIAPKDSQLTIFENAQNAERHALALDDNSADAHFQLARALGKIALFKGVLKSASIAKTVKAEAKNPKTVACPSGIGRCK